MPKVQLEHAVGDFAMWKVELDLETLEEAQACQAALGRLWASPTDAPALVCEPQARVVEAVERHEY